MRHLNIDWGKLIPLLDTWAALSPDARHVLLRLKANQYIRRASFSEDECALLISNRLLAISRDQLCVRLDPGGSEFFKAMRAMHRHPFSVASDERALAAYASDHLTTDERQALLPSRNPYGKPAFDLATRQDWLRQVLDLTSASAALKWEQTHLPNRLASSRFEDGAPYFGDDALFRATHKLLEAALTWTTPVPLAELPRRVPGVKPAMLWRAIMPAVRYLLLFPWLQGEDAEPVISLWPEIVCVLHRPAPRAPAPVQPQEIFHAPLRIEDMVTVLVAAAAEPLRVLANGGRLYAKDLQRVASAALALPDWLAPDAETNQRGGVLGVGRRISEATRMCMELKLMEIREDERSRPRLEMTEAGRGWLARDMRERIRATIEPWRPTPQTEDRPKARRRTPRLPVLSAEWDVWENGRELAPWTPPRLRWAMGPEIEQIDWRGAFVDLLTDAADGFAPLSELLDYHGRVNNPLLGRRREGSYGPRPRLHYYAGRNLSESQLENLWMDIVCEVIQQTLVPLGAVELGRTDQALTLRLHPIGRYMMGLADDFRYDARPEGAVIIQPNFEVTFLGPAPRAEAIIGRLAERTGSRIGTLFRITRSSVLAAAAAGIAVDEALRDLAEVSSKPVPENIKREVRGWFNTTRRVRMRPTWLIDSPDEHTTVQILAAAGKNARQLTPTLVEVAVPRKNHSGLIRKLKQSGIFVG